MKTYILTVSRTFPSTHQRKGEETQFARKIFNREKIHTIRKNVAIWKKRFEKIKKGEACLSLREWSGKPYRSKQVEFALLTKEDGIGIQEVSFHFCEDLPAVKSENGSWYHHSLTDVAKNDGLSRDDFKEWFKNHDRRENMVIIHFTKFRYK